MQRSIAREPNTPAIPLSGPPVRWVALPNVAMATMRSPTVGGSGRLNPMPTFGTPMTVSITSAPMEYPPMTSLVRGQLAATDCR
ncbi:Uncharacterised protein [Mycobacteroides abscessus subsp. abscessus]|nr:Uncharacterised protein [Mycobacteroides abscessus subsp. abscessus]